MRAFQYVVPLLPIEQNDTVTQSPLPGICLWLIRAVLSTEKDWNTLWCLSINWISVLFSVIIILRYEELLEYSIDNLNGYIWKEMEIMKTKNSRKRSLTQKVKVKHNNQLTLTTPNNELNEDST